MPADLSRYKVVNGTSYDARTPDAVVRVLEQARLNRTRLHISLGDATDKRYREWITGPDAKAVVLLEQLDELRGKGLLCFCPVPGPFHADVLIDLAYNY